MPDESLAAVTRRAYESAWRGWPRGATSRGKQSRRLRVSLAKLDLLALSWNQLTGPIPPELGKLSKLEYLVLNGGKPLVGQFARNQLTGAIPPELGALTMLRQLYLDPNNFSGCVPDALLAIDNNDLADLPLSLCSVVIALELWLPPP